MKIGDESTGYYYYGARYYDPVTGLPIDLGLIGGGGSGGNQLELDCYNKFLNFIDYYKDREDKPEEYYELLKYWECLLCVEKCRDCLLLPGIEEWMEENENQNGYVTPSRYIIRFCDLVIPDIPEEEEEEAELPDFAEIDLGTGVDDTWEDEEPAMTEIVADPMDVHEPVWWYHSDHLGSTTYITDLTGKPCQYIEYLPFGEVMVQQSTNNIFENSYKFNAKELDESTGYYYYGARYYDPRTSIFLSVDPLAEQFPNWYPYHYVHNNPINLIDPTGMRAEPPTEGKYDNGYVHTDSDGSWTYNDGIWSDNSGGGNDFLEGINFTVQGNNSNLSDAVSAGQMFGGAMAGVMKSASDKYMEKSFYHLGDASHHSNSLKFNDPNYQGPGIGSYSSGYQESIRSIKNLNAGLSVVSKTLDYAGYIEGGVRISQGEYAAGAHSIGNNYLGIKIGASLGWGYGVLYSASYTAFEKTLPKSELYNRIIFGANSPTYNSRRHYWQNSKFVP